MPVPFLEPKPQVMSKRGIDDCEKPKRVQIRKTAHNPSRVERVGALFKMAGIYGQFDLVAECLTSVKAQYVNGSVLVQGARWRYDLTYQAFCCFLDLPLVTAGDCLGMSASLFSHVKQVFDFHDWPCCDIYKVGIPMTPDEVFMIRERYIKWMQEPVNAKSNERLLLALQIAEKASIDYQKRLCVGRLKCSAVLALENKDVEVSKKEQEEIVEKAKARLRCKVAMDRIRREPRVTRAISRLPMCPPPFSPVILPRSESDSVTYSFHTFTTVVPVLPPAFESVPEPEPEPIQESVPEPEPEPVPGPVEIVFMGEVIRPPSPTPGQEEQQQQPVDYSLNRGRVPAFPVQNSGLTNYYDRENDVFEVVDSLTMEPKDVFSLQFADY